MPPLPSDSSREPEQWPTVDDYDRYMRGFDDGALNVIEALLTVPDEQLPAVVRNMADRRGVSP